MPKEKNLKNHDILNKTVNKTRILSRFVKALNKKIHNIYFSIISNLAHSITSPFAAAAPA
jgi:hypothetical protein